MPELTWDKVEDRVYHTGLDKGVLYLPDGTAVPWNGLTSVIEHFTNESSPIYFDGMKVSDLVVLGDFSATMQAVTYPDEFEELEGLGAVRRGLFYADQRPKSFGLCYRTQVGNALKGDTIGYRIHILYNVTAIPSDKTYATESDNPSLVEFEWSISAVPEEVPGFRPTAHIVIDTRTIDPWLLEELEALLYGTTYAEASLIPMADLVTRINSWFRVQITDNGDGTWTATAEREGFISVDVIEKTFEITGVNAIYLDDETYLLSDTTNVSEVPQIEIYDAGDGSWTASTEQSGLIVMLDENTFEIRNAHVNYQNADSFQIQDTTVDD